VKATTSETEDTVKPIVTLGETMAVLSPPSVGLVRHAMQLALTVAGSESNVAIGACRLGVPAVWIGRVGDDELGRRVLSSVRGEGVDVSQVVLDDAAPTGLMIKERRSASRTRIWYYRCGSAGSRLCPDDVSDAVVRSAGNHHITGITPALSTSAADAVRAAIGAARAATVPISLDINYRRALWGAEQAASVLRDLVAAADIVFATEDEASLVLSVSASESAASAATLSAKNGHAESADSAAAVSLAGQLARLGPRSVVVKRASRGAVCWVDGEVFDAGAYTVDCVDPVGAGDAFAAAWLAESLRGAPARQCLSSAIVAGAFAVTVAGDWEGLPSREDLHMLQGADGDVHR
jgi:2-dehydro-3-deoxygluconokinase